VCIVVIQKVPTCACSDQKQRLCKHILFVLLGVMCLEPESHVLCQDAWNNSELVMMFENADVALASGADDNGGDNDGAQVDLDEAIKS
jgi:hypothetical protein